MSGSPHSARENGRKSRSTPHRQWPSAKRALDDEIRGSDIASKHTALLALAKRLAVELDSIEGDPETLAKVAARYLSVLEALGMTAKKQQAEDKKGGLSVGDFQARRAGLRTASPVDGATA